MKLIDADILERSLTEIDEHINMDIFTNEVRELIDNVPTVESFPKDQYEARLKADMVAMLTEIQLEIQEIEEDMCIRDSKAEMGFYRWIKKSDAENIIQKKIDALRE